MSADKTKSVFQADGDTILRRYAATAVGSPGMHKTKSCWPGGGFAKQTGGGEFAAHLFYKTNRRDGTRSVSGRGVRFGGAKKGSRKKQTHSCRRVRLQNKWADRRNAAHAACPGVRRRHFAGGGIFGFHRARAARHPRAFADGHAAPSKSVSSARASRILSDWNVRLKFPDWLFQTKQTGRMSRLRQIRRS